MPTAATPKRASAAERKQQILEVALPLFAAHGFAATTTKQIAEAANITEGLIFHYFPNKAAILRELTTHGEAFIQQAQTILAFAEALPAQTVLHAISKHWAETIYPQQHLISVLIVESQTNTEVREVFMGLVEGITGAFAQFLESRQAAGELRRDFPAKAGAMMFFSSLAMFILTNRDRTQEDWQLHANQFAQDLLQAWLLGAEATS